LKSAHISATSPNVRIHMLEVVRPTTVRLQSLDERNVEAMKSESAGGGCAAARMADTRSLPVPVA
jgi:hypothetical protein